MTIATRGGPPDGSRGRSGATAIRRGDGEGTGRVLVGAGPGVGRGAERGAGAGGQDLRYRAIARTRERRAKKTVAGEMRRPRRLKAGVR